MSLYKTPVQALRLQTMPGSSKHYPRRGQTFVAGTSRSLPPATPGATEAMRISRRRNTRRRFDIVNNNRGSLALPSVVRARLAEGRHPASDALTLIGRRLTSGIFSPFIFDSASEQYTQGTGRLATT